MTERGRLKSKQRKEIQQALAQGAEVRLYRRLLALLEVDQGRPVVAVARSLQVSRRSVHAWLHTYAAAGTLEALADRPRSGRPPVWDEEGQGWLQQLLAHSPEAYGYQATVWTVPLLQEQMRHLLGERVAARTLRRHLHALGYSWKRSRYVLEPDPERGEKGAPDTSPSGAPDASERGGGRR